MGDLHGCLCLWACAHPQKRVNASVRLTGPLSRGSTVLQAGILMSLLGFSDWNRRMEVQGSDSKVVGQERNEGEEERRQ